MTQHYLRFVGTLCLVFACLVQPVMAQSSYLHYIVVAQDGSGNFKNIQDAIDAVRAYSPEHVTIYIKNGIYREKVVLPAWVTNISIQGEDREKTIITHDDYSGKFMLPDTVNNKKKFTTFNSYTVNVQGNDVSIENLTIENSAGRVGQAVALHVDGDRFIIKNCRLLGNQDTLLAANDMSRQYYLNCFIEGTTDFIFGNATALFEDCTIKSLTNSFITAASTSARQPFGYVFLRCKLIANTEAVKVYLGRPWRSYSNVVFIHCDLGPHIRTEGWQNWDKMENEHTARYAEFENTGAGAAPGRRVSWSRQLKPKEAKNYTIDKIFRDWRPA